MSITVSLCARQLPKYEGDCLSTASPGFCFPTISVHWKLPEGDVDFFPTLVANQTTPHSEMCGKDSRGVSRPVSRQKRHEGTIWQRRFWEHLIRDNRDFRRHIDYIHYNPVKTAMFQKWVDWPYSTFHRFVRNGVYPTDSASADENTAYIGESSDAQAHPTALNEID